MVIILKYDERKQETFNLALFISTTSKKEDKFDNKYYHNQEKTPKEEVVINNTRYRIYEVMR